VASGLALLGIQAALGLYLYSLARSPVARGVTLNGYGPISVSDVNDLQRALTTMSRTFGQRPFFLHLAGDQTVVTHADIGVTIDLDATRRGLMHVGHGDGFLENYVTLARARLSGVAVDPVVRLDRERATSFLRQLKSRIDRVPKGVFLDLERGKVRPGVAGIRLSVLGSLARLDLAIAAGATGAELEAAIQQPKHESKYSNLDISTVLGYFETTYSLADKDKDRAHNLRVGASILDGFILGPKEQLSFNAIVGPRDQSQGYRTAPVISQGELVDGMAGGSCQISSTLFAAAFFSGLELVNSKPHTIPSGYMKLALDAAVAYPDTDLVLGNPYSFPVVVHFRVSGGKVRAEIRGSKRPWRRVTFQRQITSVARFATIERRDDKAPKGTRLIAQRGVPGFRLIRRRLFYLEGQKKPARVEERQMRYPPTTEIVAVGIGPGGAGWKAPPIKPPYPPVPPTFELSQ
jgi:vancomycin resistance protein YoaR